MNEEKSILSVRINQMRKEINLTQEELAKKLGLNNKSSIANYESGYSIPSDEIKLNMCEIFGCSMDYLMGKTDIRNPEISLESKIYYVYENIKKFHKYISNLETETENFYEVEGIVEHVQDYLSMLENNLKSKACTPISLEDIFDHQFIVEDYKYVSGFLLVYDFLLKYLKLEGYISIENHNFIDWFNIEDIYIYISSFENYELLSFISQSVIINDKNNLNSLIQYIKKFSTCLNLAYLSDFDNNTLIEMFKKKVNLSKNKLMTNKSSIINNKQEVDINSSFYMAPVYGRISAGQPNWAEECIEGRLPIDPVLFGIVNPEEHFFLKVNGESMNKIIRNGAYALIHKQDIVENGEIAVVLVNGDEATLKKFSKQGDLVILEPMSNDPSFTTQVYNKDTQIKILGKYVGKFEINK